MKPTLPCIFAAAALACASGSALRSEDAANKFAPLTYAPAGNLGQALVDMEMAKHPELKLITLHVTPKGVAADSEKDRCILFSTIGRIGKHDNQEDLDVVKAGQEKTEVATDPAPGVPSWSPTSTPKFEVLTPLLDSSGKTIGLAVIVFAYKKGDDTGKFTKAAHDIRDEIRDRTPSKDALLDPAS